MILRLAVLNRAQRPKPMASPAKVSAASERPRSLSNTVVLWMRTFIFGSAFSNKVHAPGDSSTLQAISAQEHDFVLQQSLGEAGFYGDVSASDIRRGLNTLNGALPVKSVTPTAQTAALNDLGMI